MLDRAYLAAALIAASVLAAAPANAAGEILITHAKALAGNVTPGDPPGYPVVLTVPGSYQFASNIHPAANTVGIQIASDDVTLDLNGFRLHGGGNAYYGIASPNARGTIKNGTVAGFRYDGLVLAGHSWMVENVFIQDNGRHGVNGSQRHRLRFSNLTVSSNGGTGIVCGPLCRIESAIVSHNSRGISCGSHCSVEDSTVSINLGLGVECDVGCRVADSVISDNTQDGIKCIGSCHVQGNMISSNQGEGIEALSGGAVQNTIFSNVGFGMNFVREGGWGQNALFYNNASGGNVQTDDAFEMHPNVCTYACE